MAGDANSAVSMTASVTSVSLYPAARARWQRRFAFFARQPVVGEGRFRVDFRAREFRDRYVRGRDTTGTLAPP